MKKQIFTPTCSTVELEEALKVLEGRWKILILFHLFSAPVLRFSELLRAVSGISQKMLIQQLRDLEKDGVVHRKEIYASDGTGTLGKPGLRSPSFRKRAQNG
jgi:DNA-binding HxlR family transcriptional regulator